MFLELCIYTGDSRVANKNLPILTRIEGTLRYPASLINPTIRIDMSNMESMQGMKEDFITNVNYFYLPEFARYYFITSKIIENNGIATITGHVDVLKTYYNDYKNLTAFVLRSANSYNAFIEDTELPFEHKPLIEEWIPTNDTVNYPIAPLSWNEPCATSADPQVHTLHTKDLRYAVTYYQSRVSQASSYGVIKPFTGTDLPRYNYQNMDCFEKGRNIAISAYTKLNVLMESILDNTDTVASYIASVVAFPFSLYISYDGEDRTIEGITTFEIGGSGNHGTTLNFDHLSPFISYSDTPLDSAIVASYSPYILIGVFQFPDPTWFADYEPYTKYELYLPFVGYVHLPNVKLLSKRIWVYLSVNYSTGNGTINVYATEKSSASAPTSNLVFTQQCQIGIQIPIGKSNQEEIDRNKKSIGISTTISALGSLVTTALGVASQNPVAAIGGAMGVVSSIGGASASLVNLATHGNSPTSSEISSVGTSLDIKIRRTKLVPTMSYNEYTTTFKDKFGLPRRSVVSLSVLSGITYIDPTSIVLNITAMEEEKDELKSLLESGVIL